MRAHLDDGHAHHLGRSLISNERQAKGCCGSLIHGSMANARSAGDPEHRRHILPGVSASWRMVVCDACSENIDP